MNTLSKAALTSCAAATLIVSTYGCDQPRPKCAAARTGFAAQYVKVAGPVSCDALKGEHLGITTYQAVGKDEKPNLDVSSIAIQSESLGSLGDAADAIGSVDPDPEHVPYGYGFFNTAEPSSDFCAVPSLTVARKDFPLVKANPEEKKKEFPASSVSYAWSNFKLLVTAQKLGTQFAADLVLTTDGVECGYRVIAMAPYVDCNTPDPADAKGVKQLNIPDYSKCLPEADVAAGRATGSGIDPDFPTKCDTDLFACVLTKDVLPALK